LEGKEDEVNKNRKVSLEESAERKMKEFAKPV